MPAALGAEPEPVPELETTVTIEFANGYIWRGMDFYTDYARQNHEAPGPNTGAWAFMPSIDIATPLDGFGINLWFGLALDGRKDTDMDQLWNNGSRTLTPSQSRAVIENNRIYGADDTTNEIYHLLDSGSISATALAGSSLPAVGYTKEAVGLERYDEMDVTFYYSKETKQGTIGAGMVAYVLLDPRSKSLPYQEIYVSYGLPFILDPTFTLYTDFQSNGTYLSFELSHSFELDQEGSTTLDLGLDTGYVNGPALVSSTGESFNLITHYGGKIGISSHGFYVNLHGLVRPNLEWVDTDAGKNKLAWLSGASNNRDGLQEDYSRSQGVINAYINEQIQTALNAHNSPSKVTYTYTPRTKIPRYLWWVSVGYSFSL